MLRPEDQLEILDYVENFDQKNIQFVLLCTTMRSGVMFLHSLLDQHPQILQIPTYFYYYHHWESGLKQSPTHTLAADLFKKNGLSIPACITGLGVNRDQELNLRFEEVYEELNRLIPSLGTPTRKKLLLLFHFVYAKVWGMDFNQIRVLLFQHHAMPTLFSYFAFVLMHCRYFTHKMLETLLALTPQAFMKKGDPVLAQVLRDFPAARFLIPIREPMAALHSTLQNLRKTDPDLEDLGLFYISFYQVLMGYYNLYAFQQFLGHQVHLTRIEEIHTQAKNTMQAVAAFLGVDFQESMLTSTLGGHPWAGNAANQQPIFGPDPSFGDRNNHWQAEWDIETQAFAMSLCNPLTRLFGYAPYSPAPHWDIEQFCPLEANIYQRFPAYLMRLFSQMTQRLESFIGPDRKVSSKNIETFTYNQTLIQQRFLCWQEYPSLRSKTLQYLLQTISTLETYPPLISNLAGRTV